MFYLNRIQLIGYLTQPVSLRQTPGGTSVADLNIGTPYTFTTDAGQTLAGTGYHSVVAWSGMADVAAQYLRPGSQVFLSGRLQTDSWDDAQSGEKKSKTRIIAMDLIMLDPKNGQLKAPEGAPELASCLNRVDLIGNLTKDPEARTTTSGKSVVSMGVATNERWKDKQSGEIKERVEYHNVVLWGDLAKHCSEHLKKGQRIHVSGRVQTRSWETPQGQKRYTTEVNADTVSLLGVKNDAIAYSNEARTFTKKEASVGAGANADANKVPVAAGADIPPIQYESEVKVEELPF